MNYNLESIACNVCGADNFQTISNKGKNGLPTNVVLCKNCGLGYLNPRWDAESYMSFYRDEYDHYYRPKILKVDTYDETEKNPIEHRLKHLGHFPDSVNTILDIGSGEGKNLKHFARLFPKSSLLAIEPSSESQRQLSEFGVTTISNDVDADWESNYSNQIDLIIMRHVLEHFMDPLSTLRKLKNTLSKDGIIYIAVPNNLKPKKHLESNWFRNVHTYYFNKYSLNNLLILGGYEILDMVEGDHFNSSEIYLIARPTESNLEPAISSDDFQKQLTVFEDQLRKDRSVVGKLTLFIKQLIK